MGGPSPNWEMCFEMGLTLAEVGRDQKHTLRTGCFLSAEHFPGILLPSCQEAVFILLVEAGIHCYVVCILATMENSQQSRMAPWGSCKVDSWSQTCLFFFLKVLPSPAKPAVLIHHTLPPQSLGREEQRCRDISCQYYGCNTLLPDISQLLLQMPEPRLVVFWREGLTLCCCTHRLHCYSRSLCLSSLLCCK